MDNRLIENWKVIMYIQTNFIHIFDAYYKINFYILYYYTD